ncbi:PTS sugar transporter subunit IIA [Aeromonas sobria]|uniref:PTS sugar transporter subunit IIA n=1 Tax=Aeromonas sobria TaxID=646 RepID=UPI001118E155|nr:PTS sugar transporter subunit IIA [Aeromonas sobria]TNH97924.1 PTS fructose transporter subunit IIA [Aeromonas sobria]
MLRILIATHGSLAPALLASASMVYGEMPAVATVSLTEEGGIEAFRAEFEQTLRQHGAGSDGVLVLCDMECGTPYNVACRFAFDSAWPQPVAVVTGVNFPMLLMSADWLAATDVHEAARQLLAQALESMVIAAPAVTNPQDDNF